MFRVVLMKELWEGIYGYKFLLIFTISIILIPLSMYSGARRYQEELRQYQQALHSSARAFRNQEPKHPHEAAHFGRTISKPPIPLSIFSSGLQDALGVTAQIDPHYTPRLTGSRYETMPIFSILGQFDFAFCISLIFSLLAIVSAFDLISGEKEAGTLRLILSHPISRSDLLLGKIVAGLLILFTPMAVAFLAGLLFLPAFGISLDAPSWARAAMIFLASLSYIGSSFLLGTFVSTRTSRAMGSLIWLLLIWASFTFVIPRIAVTVAQTVCRVPSVQEVEMQIEAIRREENEKSARRFQAYRASNPHQPIPPEVAVQLRRQKDEALEERESKVMYSYQAALHRQIRLAVNIARLSPAFAYVHSAMELSGTGVERHTRFLRFLDEYRRAFRDYFDDLERRGVQVVTDFEAVPEFSFAEEPLGSTIKRIIPDLGLIGGVMVALFASAYFSFTKYDVR
jgi:ABC-type transport system involved in multi-copper enzyme maturation permease subunit